MCHTETDMEHETISVIKTCILSKKGNVLLPKLDGEVGVILLPFVTLIITHCLLIHYTI
jgi:hypothetical protein